MQPLLYRVRRRFGALATDSFFRGLSSLGRLHPLSRPERHNVVVHRDVAYRPTGSSAHKLDVYTLAAPPSTGARRPVVVYAHGGGFRILSKDTHWVMGLVFARAGYVVFNINYELAPRYPFPAAVRDACAAYQWVLGHAQEYGGDPRRIVLAGESAGANLATAVAIAASYERDEPYARAVYEAGVSPRAVVAACGLLQVSDVARFTRARTLPVFVRDRLDEVSSAYLDGADRAAPGGLALADPLCVLERDTPPSRPLPPFFASVGTRDPILDDTRRLRAALGRLKVECEDRYYPGEPHAFQAVVFRSNARLHWKACFAFLERHVGAA